MQFTVFINTREGRTIVDEYAPTEGKTFFDLVKIYEGDFVKIDAYTDEGKFMRSVFLDPEGYETWGAHAVQAPVIRPTEPVGV